MYSRQIEAEIERLESWETIAIRWHYLEGREIHSWDDEIWNRQTELMFNIWIEEYEETRPFVRTDFKNSIGRMKLPDDVILLHQSIINACAEKTRLALDLCWEEQNEELREEAATHCATEWHDPRYRSVLRCMLEPDGFCNVIREGALARLRCWIKRISNGRFSAATREDLFGLIRISNAVLSRVRTAFTWEAPSSFLGADDLEIVRWTYPAVCGIPAECSVSKKQLLKEWKIGHPEFDTVECDDFEDWADARRLLYYSDWYLSEYPSRANPSTYDVDFECRSVGLRMVAIAIREAERFGLTRFELPGIDNENDALELIERIVALTISGMTTNATLQLISDTRNTDPLAAQSNSDLAASTCQSATTIDLWSGYHAPGLWYTAFNLESQKWRRALRKEWIPKKLAERDPLTPLRGDVRFLKTFLDSRGIIEPALTIRNDPFR